MHTQGTASTIGKLALLVGALAAIMTTYALIAKRRNGSTASLPAEFDGWDDSLGV